MEKLYKIQARLILVIQEFNIADVNVVNHDYIQGIHTVKDKAAAAISGNRTGNGTVPIRAIDLIVQLELQLKEAVSKGQSLFVIG